MAAGNQMVNMELREDDLSGGAIAALLREHLDGMAQHSPPERSREEAGAQTDERRRQEGAVEADESVVGEAAEGQGVAPMLT